MWQSRIEAKYIQHATDRLYQGDILRDITLAEWSAEKKEGDNVEIDTVKRMLVYSIVVTQDCDLLHDFRYRNDGTRKNDDKFLQSVLLCPAYPAAQVKIGTHLQNLNLNMQKFESGKMWDSLVQNHLYRYHYLEAHDALSVPELVLDFKHAYTVPRNEIYRQDIATHYLASLNEIYRENLSDRYAHFLARVALPID